MPDHLGEGWRASPNDMHVRSCFCCRSICRRSLSMITCALLCSRKPRSIRKQHQLVRMQLLRCGRGHCEHRHDLLAILSARERSGMRWASRRVLTRDLPRGLPSARASSIASPCPLAIHRARAGAAGMRGSSRFARDFRSIPLLVEHRRAFRYPSARVSFNLKPAAARRRCGDCA